MLRIACADVDRVSVKRRGDLTILVQPRIGDRDTLLAQGRALLTDEELAIIRAVLGVPFNKVGAWQSDQPEIACPCGVPSALRCETSDWSCPLHEDVLMLA